MLMEFLPVEVLFEIRDNLPSEVDRQSLRYSCRKFYFALPPPPCRLSTFNDPDIRPKGGARWLSKHEQWEFQERLFLSLDLSRRKEREVCKGCLRVTKAIIPTLPLRVTWTSEVSMKDEVEDQVCVRCGYILPGRPRKRYRSI